jgi:hypothetical protein
MQSYNEVLLSPRRASAIRWPFRLLALLIVAGSLSALLGNAYLAITRKDPTAALLVLGFVPIAALIGRFGGYAIWKGAVLRNNPYWPFASGSLVAAWLLIAGALGSFR